MIDCEQAPRIANATAKTTKNGAKQSSTTAQTKTTMNLEINAIKDLQNVSLITISPKTRPLASTSFANPETKISTSWKPTPSAKLSTKI